MPRKNQNALKSRTRPRRGPAVDRSFVHLLDDFGNAVEIVRLLGPATEPDHMIFEFRDGTVGVKHMMHFTSAHRAG